MPGSMRLAVQRPLFAAALVMGVLAAATVGAEAPRGAYSAAAEAAFARGLEAYGAGEYAAAAAELEQLLEFPTHQRTTAGMLLLSRARFRLGQYQRALAAAQGLERRFGDSRYVAHARLVAGDCYFQLKRYYDAAAQYGRILATPAPLAVQGQATERLAAIVDNGMINATALERIRGGLGHQRLNEALLYGRARWYARLGWEALGAATLQAYRDSMPDGMFHRLSAAESGTGTAGRTPPAAAVPPAISPGRRPLVAGERPRLGLLLPLTGADYVRRVGEDLHAGVQLANEAAAAPFEIVVADIGMEYGDLPVAENESSRLLRVLQQTRRLIYDEGVVAIVGPVYSSDCIAAGVVAQQAGVPLIAPLAQQSGLEQVGSCLFQLSAIPEVQARALAEYATLVLGLRTLAVISPLTDYGWSFEREFQRVAYENGGEVVHADWYVPEVTKDFRRVFEEIRQVGFALMPPPPDTLAASDTLAALLADSPAGQAGDDFLSELLAGLEETPAAPAAVTPPDSSEIFIDSIQGIAVVVERFADAQTIAPQLHYHRLQTQVLGNDMWYDPEAIRQLRPTDRAYLEGTVLVSGYVEEDTATRQFTDAFRRRFGRSPQYAAFAYDATRMLAQAWDDDQPTPAALRERLAAVEDFSGASGRITFAGQVQTNAALELLKIDPRGRVRRVQAEDLPALSGGGPESAAGGELPRESLLPEELTLPR